MQNKINLDVIDQMFSAQISANESEATLEALRPKAMEAVQELIRQRGLPKNFTGTIEYHGFKIVVSRPTSYTWEQNTQIQDASLDYYKTLFALHEQLRKDLRKRSEEMKGLAKSLALTYPNSVSIKHGFRIAFQVPK